MTPGVRPELPSPEATLPLLGDRTPDGWKAPPLMAAAVVAGDFDVQLLAEAGVVANLVEQVALGLRQRFQRHRLAAAAQQRLDGVEVQGGDADRAFGLRKLKTVWLEKLSSSRAPVGSTLLKPTPLLSVQLLCWPSGVFAAGIFADRLLRGEELGHEREPLLRHRQGGEVEVLALVLVLAAVEHGQFGRLVQRQQVRGPARDIERTTAPLPPR